MKLFVIGEVTGYTSGRRVMDELCQRLAEKTDLTVFGVGYRGDPHDRPYKLYPASLYDPWGMAALSRALGEERPDKVLIVGNLRLVNQYLPVVNSQSVSVLFTNGGLNMPLDIALALSAVDNLLSFTQAAADTYSAAVELIRAGVPKGDVKSITLRSTGVEVPVSGLDRATKVVGFGVDTKTFMPYPTTARLSIRKQLGLPERAFVIGAIGSNTRLSRMDMVISAFAALPDQTKEQSVLLIHSPVIGAVNLAEVAEYHGVANKVLFSWNQDHPAEDSDIAGIHNILDVHVNLSSGDNLPLGIMESAACGVAQLVPDTPQNLGLAGDNMAPLMVPVMGTYFDPVPNGTRHSVVCADHAAISIAEMQASKDLQQHSAERWYDLAMALPTWDTVVHNIMKELVDE